MTDESYQNLIDLANRHIEDRLDAVGRKELESILQGDPEARRDFTDFLHDHAALHWENVSNSENQSDITPFTRIHSPVRRANWFAWSTGTAALLAVTALVLVLLSGKNTDTPPTFATMETTRSARWQSGDLPTAAGARLSEGTLTLSEGLATLRFDSGAEVILEAPAEIRLIDRMNCELTQGTAVADIPETAIGFRIGTPAANVVDYGTRFAVNVEEETGATHTQVFEGLVEVEHPNSGEIVQLKTGETNLAAVDSVTKATTAPDEPDWDRPAPKTERSSDWTVLPTARDAYIFSADIKVHHSNELLLLKNSSDNKGPHRKVYLGFDLGNLPLDRIAEAELTLNFSPTGWGLAALVPDAEFTVYGVTGQVNDQWEKSTLHWDTAPTNDPDSGDGLESGTFQQLGTFTVEQGIQRGEFGISGEKLASFLGDQEDAFATLIIVRNTKESGGAGLVHGIASRRHPALPAPTLAIRLN